MTFCGEVGLAKFFYKNQKAKLKISPTRPQSQHQKNQYSVGLAKSSRNIMLMLVCRLCGW